ncbi:hypothetical protein WMF18_39700 [Sorangium sp. So ce315]|uniref:acyl carrier protein n=1 Tax=Sorangium sp. So ce315 TaxID=3133299 RepID=UPI003F5E152C
MDTGRGLALNPQEREALYALLRDKLQLDGTVELADTTVVRELPGVDSMMLFRLLGAVELTFRVHLGFESIPAVQTLRDVERVICKSREEIAARAL